MEGAWAVFAKIAGRFAYKVMSADREDFQHDLLVEMARVKAKYDARGKSLTEGGLMRVARYEVLAYWHNRRLRLFGISCNNCTVERRSLCRATIEPSQCPKGKAHRLLRMNEIIQGKNGDKPTELLELVAGKSDDIDARLDARRILQGLPKKLVKTGYKVYAGIPLETEEKRFLNRWRKVHLAPLVQGRDHLGERILEQLRNNPQGMTRSGLAGRLDIYVRELNFDLTRLIKGQQVVAVKRGNTRGPPMSSLLFIAGTEIPEQRNVKAERDERITHARSQGWGINRISEEFHHDKRTVRRAIYGTKVKRR